MSTAPVRIDLTVVMCTFNGERYLERQLRSLVSQTISPAAWIIADDGSRDGSVDLARRALESAAEQSGATLQVLDPSSVALGPTRNFERALRAARTPLVALSDQDDEWHPERLARTASRMDDPDRPLLVASNTRLIDSAGSAVPGDSFSLFGLSTSERIAISTPQGLLEVLMRRNFLQGMTFTLNRQLLDHAGPAPDPFLHDYWLALTAAALGRMTVLEEPLVAYRLHSSNTVGGGERSRLLRQLKFLHWLATQPREGTPRRLREWTAVETSLLRRLDLPSAHRQALEEKVRFEHLRFRGNKSLSTQFREMCRLVRRGQYTRFDRDGPVGMITDLRWKRVDQTHLSD